VVAGTASFADLKRVLGDAELIHETQDTPKKYLFCRVDSLGELTSKNHALERLPDVTYSASFLESRNDVRNRIRSSPGPREHREIESMLR